MHPQIRLANTSRGPFPLYCEIQRPRNWNRNSVHTHDAIEVVHVIQGSGITLIDGVPYPILAGDLYVINVGATHAYEELGDGLAFYNLLFQERLFSAEELDELQAVPGFGTFFRFGGPSAGTQSKLSLSPAQREIVGRRFGALTDEIQAQQPGWHLGAKAHLVDLLLTVCRLYVERHDPLVDAAQREASPVTRAIAWLHEHYRDKVTLEILAEEVGLSANYLGERFKKATGQAVHDYVNRLRVETARQLLERGEARVTDIAGEAGFEDPSYFTKVFRQVTGMSPRAYRQAARKM